MNQISSKLFLLPLSIFFSILTIDLALAQEGIGIGTDNVDPSAILQIDAQSNNKGVLFPRSGPVMMYGIRNSTLNGLFLYDTIANKYAYSKNQVWMYLNPWDTEEIMNNTNVSYITTNYNVGIGTSAAPTTELEVSGDVKADKFEGLGVVPLGGIIMWSGTTVPSDYQLCDGSTRNGYTTPNLVGRFIVGGATGATGAGSNALGTTQISYQETPAYMINGSTCQSQQFRYSFSYTETCDPPGDPLTIATINVNNVVANSCAAAQSPYTTSDPDCSHTNFSSCTTSNNPNYYLTNPACFDASVSVVNVVTGTDNRPLFYQLAYIMRVE
ncbi:MAG: hypothetical protein ABJF11_03735 [Reichenbachiella sp.]|uniref:hypothetical protein n=1 Tax=Reichenbachiella sp. TaxID=2184521 RepID=UPI00326760A3